MDELAGRVAVVTGGGRGIGRSTAVALAAGGASVAVCARTASEIEQVAAEIGYSGHRAVPIEADLSISTGVQSAADQISEIFGHVDILVNNVGGSQSNAPKALTDDDWENAHSLNFMSAVRMTSRFIPAMELRGDGSVINVASISGREPGKFVGPYSAAKAALINYSKWLSDVYAPSGVRVNTILPGIIETSATSRNATVSALATNRTETEVMESMLKRNPVPLGRLGRPEEVASLIRLLVSPDVAFITGATVIVDGGAHRYA
jgi:NAD(P)-dependent dehydrogenase (short-subunit alcohol dehydrogenase family)